MENKLLLFNIISMDEKAEQKFHQFFHQYNLLPLFTNEHRSTQIRVSDSEMRAVINEHGAYHDTLKHFADYLLIASDNKKYEEAVFKVIYEARSFAGLMKNIKKIMDYDKHNLKPEHQYNLWNVVFYNKDLK